MSIRIIGTCSLCGGPVGVPHAWLGVRPPTPQCQDCGATMANPYGPSIPMVKPPKYIGLAPLERSTELPFRFADKRWGAPI